MTDEKSLLRTAPLDSSSEKKSISLRSLNGLKSLSIAPSRMTSGTKQRLCSVTLIVLVALVAGVFLIPFIVHLVQVAGYKAKRHSCLSTSSTNETQCDSISWASIANESTVCSNSERLNDDDSSTCREFLQYWQTCAIDSRGRLNDDVFVSRNKKQKELEPFLPVIIGVLKNSNSSCSSVGIPFLCQYALTLCDKAHGIAFLPSRQECEHISTVACAKEWKEAKSIDESSLLPNCNDLPNQTHPESVSSDVTDTNSADHYRDAYSSFAESNTSDHLDCNEQFYENDNKTICLPSCHRFKQNSDETTAKMKIIEIWTGLFGFIFSLIAILLSIVVRYKTMLRFPSVLLVYMTINLGLISFIVLLSLFDRNKLYCSSEDLLYSLYNPTPFCTVSGVIFQYCIVSATLFWFSHVSVLFYKLVFPVAAKRMEKYDKYIHISALIMGILLPSPAVIYTLVNSKYIIAEFPPLICLPEDVNIWYYSTILLFNLLAGTGMCMFVPMFWIVHKHSRVGKQKFSIAGFKILCVLSYYAVFALTVVLYFGITAWNDDAFLAAVKAYFECELFGVSSDIGGKCDPACFRRYTVPEVKAISFVLMSFIPVANLAFVINWKKVVKIFDYCKAKLHTAATARSSHHPQMIRQDDYSVFSVSPEND